MNRRRVVTFLFGHPRRTARQVVSSGCRPGPTRTLEPQAFEPSSAASLRKNGPTTRGLSRPGRVGPSQPGTSGPAARQRGKRGGTAVPRGRPRGTRGPDTAGEPPMTYPQVSTDPHSEDHASTGAGVPPTPRFPLIEERVLAYWQTDDTF